MLRNGNKWNSAQFHQIEFHRRELQFNSNYFHSSTDPKTLSNTAIKYFLEEALIWEKAEERKEKLPLLKKAKKINK